MPTAFCNDHPQSRHKIRHLHHIAPDTGQPGPEKSSLFIDRRNTLSYFPVVPILESGNHLFSFVALEQVGNFLKATGGAHH
jgi:hypothetical protein